MPPGEGSAPAPGIPNMNGCIASGGSPAVKSPRDPIAYMAKSAGMNPWADQTEMAEYCDKVTLLCENNVLTTQIFL